MNDKEDLKSKLQELFNNWNDEESEKVIKDLMNARQILKEKRSIVFEVKTYNLPANENIVLYGAKNKRYIK